jgi:hypothetical protein
MKIVDPVNKPALNNYLIDHWDLNGVLKSKTFNINLSAIELPPPSDTTSEMNIGDKTKPACGNLHAVTGNKIVIMDKDGQNTVFTYTEDSFLDELIKKEYKKLGPNVLVSAGHFMPHKKSNFLNVNSNSLTSLVYGLKSLKLLRELNIEADLFITINDLTIGGEVIGTNTGSTMTIEERANYYTAFSLPLIYNKIINDYRISCNANFNLFVIGENKLAEKLKKDTKKLVKKGIMEKQNGGYTLAFDASYEREIAHGIKEAHSPNSVFISTEAGTSGRPKCVRACARLSAIPLELGYSGYLQFLPVCSRNAIEGFLIGRKLYNINTPFISIHNTFSCF